MANEKSSPKDYGRWGKVGIVLTGTDNTKKQQKTKQQTTAKKKVKKGK